MAGMLDLVSVQQPLSEEPGDGQGSHERSTGDIHSNTVTPTKADYGTTTLIKNADVAGEKGETTEDPGENKPLRKVDFGFLPILPRLRYDPTKPPPFGILLNVVYGFASTFIIANLTYCQPLLIQMALSFNVSHSEVSKIPTVIQAGYAAGALLISPLGDLIRRRPLLLIIVTLTTSLTIGLAVTRSLSVFLALSFLVGTFSVTPQILITLTADLAPPHRRATAISIVLAGLLLGVLVARVVAGVIAEYAPWRSVYYMAIGVQALILFCLWATVPDYPPKNKGLTYFGVLWSMAKSSVTEPALIQACLVNFLSSACFMSFWVTLTFLLGGSPYNYSTLVIGLFGLIGIVGILLSPLVGRVIDSLIPWYGSLIATMALLVVQGINTAGSGLNISVVVIVCIGLDVARQMQQVSLTTAVFNISESMRSRLNAVMIIAIFAGSMTGTAVGTLVFDQYGWRASAGLSLGLTGLQLLVIVCRGPHVERKTWVGYQGGTEWNKRVVMEREMQMQQMQEKDSKDKMGTEDWSRSATEKQIGTSEVKEAEKNDAGEVETDPSRIV